MAERRAGRARRPDRARSQHFLRSQALAAQLVREAGVRPDELVLDLGAGSGRLTAELAGTADRVLAVELDARWADALSGRWANVEVVQADAVSLGLPSEPFRVVASLPFDRTTDILRHLLDDPSVPLIRADVVVEWGVAVKRALPWPSTLNDVLWGAWYSSSVGRRLPRACFDPPPAVDAGVLVFQRRARALVPERCWQAYRGFAARGFRRGLRAVAPPRTLRKLRLARAEPRDLDAHQWAELFSSCAASATRPRRPRRAARSP
ncbi:MAG TPA: rRNA adenine N(6)-methyltransferase family protein [Gaiellaceae bacterium]|nr:rRNA adenine N(6)-methyltransferase family protein [Gaiellaceae bacterium]